ncbi:hypothetical protein QOT17_023964 [Balamuthia mandrillaris]
MASKAAAAANSENGSTPPAPTHGPQGEEEEAEAELSTSSLLKVPPATQAIPIVGKPHRSKSVEAVPLRRKDKEKEKEKEKDKENKVKALFGSLRLKTVRHSLKKASSSSESLTLSRHKEEPHEEAEQEAPEETRSGSFFPVRSTTKREKYHKKARSLGKNSSALEGLTWQRKAHVGPRDLDMLYALFPEAKEMISKEAKKEEEEKEKERKGNGRKKVSDFVWDFGDGKEVPRLQRRKKRTGEREEQRSTGRWKGRGSKSEDEGKEHSLMKMEKRKRKKRKSRKRGNAKGKEAVEEQTEQSEQTEAAESPPASPSLFRRRGRQRRLMMRQSNNFHDGIQPSISVHSRFHASNNKKDDGAASTSRLRTTTGKGKGKVVHSPKRLKQQARRASTAVVLDRSLTMLEDDIQQRPLPEPQYNGLTRPKRNLRWTSDGSTETRIRSSSLSSLSSSRRDGQDSDTDTETDNPSIDPSSHSEPRPPSMMFLRKPQFSFSNLEAVLKNEELTGSYDSPSRRDHIVKSPISSRFSNIIMEGRSRSWSDSDSFSFQPPFAGSSCSDESDSYSDSDTNLDEDIHMARLNKEMDRISVAQ